MSVGVERVAVGNYKVSTVLYKAVTEHILPGTGVSESHFWRSLAELLNHFGPENDALLQTRDTLQRQIDEWYLSQREKGPLDVSSDAFIKEQAHFLTKIGYIHADLTRDPAVTVSTANVDDEIATIPGPQLVVPVDNLRFVLNAINARWGSLFTTVYNSDVFPKAATNGALDPAKAAKVVAFCLAKLDEFLPLQGASWTNARRVAVENISGIEEMQFVVIDAENKRTTLVHAASFRGFNGSGDKGQLLFCHHDLHIIVDIDPGSKFARYNSANIGDVIIESTLTAIMDCEDSVTAVDAEDKATVYKNWAGLMKGALEVKITQGGKTVVRKMNPDRSFRSPRGESINLPGRVLALIRNVGMHMYTDAIVDAAGKPVPEGLLDAMITVVAAVHDVRRNSEFCNSKHGSIYVVKPKMHGPQEVDFVCRSFTHVEMHLGLPKNTIKIGIMDEERRTSLNLAECLRAAHERCFFINTGFLDRTGDEIHTCMAGGPVLPKADIKKAPWISAYEKLNALTGIHGNLLGRAQIGKGMWAEPDSMAAMLAQKIAHPQAGANTAWVPSPVAGTLHALHYHMVDVKAVQKKLSGEPFASKLPLQDQLLTPPLCSATQLSQLSRDRIVKELENNAQGILGYMVRWIDLGVGCSKVPDINGVGLMEDRATLRIAAQHVGNWLHHGIISNDMLEATFRKMAAIVDTQNAKDPRYTPMHKDCENNVAFQTALKMCRTATAQPNGYTESTLTDARRRVKAKIGSSL
eukprot:GEMP01005491.1.p1 GENE.GEMP01005491.1~~GEMP01005491.1.p1  ORF type:complete len:750 (+),score=242.34 GEMP01005491.1:120-2369(+)